MRLSRIALGASARALAGVTAAEASAWTRHSTTYTSHGTYDRAVVGPYGRSFIRTGTVTVPPVY